MSNLFKIAQMVCTTSGLEPCWIIQLARWFQRKTDLFWDISRTLSSLCIRKEKDMTSYSVLIKTPISTVPRSKNNLSWHIKESLRKQFQPKSNGKVAVIQPWQRRRKRERERKSPSKRKLIHSSISSRIEIQTPLELWKMHSMREIMRLKTRSQKKKTEEEEEEKEEEETIQD